MPVIEVSGSPRRVCSAFGTLRDCAFCARPFTITSITGRQFYCSESCKEKAAWRRERTKPRIVALNRERCRAWAAANRAVKASNAWLLGAPPHGEFLPGGAFSIKISPTPQWPIELRNTRALHGLATTLLGKPHEPGAPGFALIPSDRAECGWGLYVPTSDARRFANFTTEAVLFDKTVAVTTGPFFELKAPNVIRRGRRRLRIDCLTPVVIRSQGGTVRHVVPHASNLLSTLGTWTPQRVGVTIGTSDATMVLIERETHAEWTQMGGKYGATAGFIGHLIVECNAVSEWLLRCCETIGFGGKTAFGFGRIKVSDA